MQKEKFVKYFYNFRFLDCLSHIKSIIDENQQNYPPLMGLFANYSKLQPNLLWSFEKFVDRNRRKRPKSAFETSEIIRNFAIRLTETDRKVSRNSRIRKPHLKCSFTRKIFTDYFPSRLLHEKICKFPKH